MVKVSESLPGYLKETLLSRYDPADISALVEPRVFRDIREDPLQQTRVGYLGCSIFNTLVKTGHLPQRELDGIYVVGEDLARLAKVPLDILVSALENGSGIRANGNNTIRVQDIDLLAPYLGTSRRKETRAPLQRPSKDAFDDYLSEVGRKPMNKDRNVQNVLSRSAQEGNDAARHRLVETNLRFVISYVKKYQNKGLSLSELVAIGNEGLLHATFKYNPDAGVNFISYGVWWVRQAVLKALAEQSRTVRIPLNENSRLWEASRHIQTLIEIAGVSENVAMSRVCQEMRIDPNVFMNWAGGALSLDAPVDRDDDRTTFVERLNLEDSVLGSTAPKQENCLYEKELRASLDGILDRVVTEREKKILYLYYGVEGEPEGMTLEEIGEMLGITRERVRQIRERAFEKLRESPESKELAQYWAD